MKEEPKKPLDGRCSESRRQRRCQCRGPGPQYGASRAVVTGLRGRLRLSVQAAASQRAPVTSPQGSFAK